MIGFLLSIQNYIPLAAAVDEINCLLPAILKNWFLPSTIFTPKVQAILNNLKIALAAFPLVGLLSVLKTELNAQPLRASIWW